ncbi:unnamed protein product [marine sediment metagenome]|uniref:Uncharacterized protein n=1 Tax=marine sediment metagenome TaxID=412755 RepID=X0YAR4_9ZZZZ
MSEMSMYETIADVPEDVTEPTCYGCGHLKDNKMVCMAYPDQKRYCQYTIMVMAIANRN